MKNIFSSYTAKIIIINVVAFFAFLILAQIVGIEKATGWFAMQPAAIFAGQKIWTLFTSMFMHANLTHLFVNMFSLFFIGNLVEKIVGKKRYLAFYLISGIFAGFFFALLSFYFGNSLIGERLFGNPMIYGVGASGAIFGLLGLLAVLTPRNRVYLIAGPIVAIILQVLLTGVLPPALGSALDILVTIYIILSIFFVFSFNPRTRRIALPIELPFWLLPVVAIVPLMIIGLFVSLPIGNMAHLGGLLAGLAFGYYLIKKYPRRAALISRIFSK